MSYEIKYDALTPVENDDIPNIIDKFLSDINGDTLISEIPKIFNKTALDYETRLIEVEMSDYVKNNYYMTNFNEYKASKIFEESKRLENIYDFGLIIYQGLLQIVEDMKKAYYEDIIKDIASCCIKDISIDEFIEDIEDNRRIELSPKISPKELREICHFDFKELEEWYFSTIGNKNNDDLFIICDYFFDALIFELLEITIKIHGKK